jgi:gamma-butyrobetaine dioxygenase
MTARSVAEVLDLFARHGAERYDEDVFQVAHAEQSAALATQAGAAPPLVAAALLHDVGHLLELAEHGVSATAPPTSTTRRGAPRGWPACSRRR